MNKPNGNNGALAASPESTVTQSMALLMLDLASSDNQLAAEELSLIRSLLAKQFLLSELEVETLLDDANRALNDQSDLWDTLHNLNLHLTRAQKKELISQLWRIVYADGRLDGHEDHLLHKIADLLKLDHDELIQSKLAVKADMNL